MASIFRKDDNHVDKPNRNTFDLSFQNNVTTRFGRLIPCYCQEVIPGDSFKIQPTFGLRYLPQVFPVQTRMRANLHFFYVRNRTLWKDWMDFIGKTKDDLVSPYLEVDSLIPRHGKVNPYEVSSIFDYMGLPVTIDSLVDTRKLISNYGTRKNVRFTLSGVQDSVASVSYFYLPNSLSLDDTSHLLISDLGNVAQPNVVSYESVYYEFDKPIVLRNESSNKFSYQDDGFEMDYILTGVSSFENYHVYLYCKVYDVVSCSLKLGFFNVSTYFRNGNVMSSTISDFYDTRISVFEVYGYVVVSDSRVDAFEGSIFLGLQVLPSLNRGYPISGLGENSTPYRSTDIRVNALPFRAYEAVYNSFYRNAENNPFMVDGVPEYNRYVKSLDGGAQSAYDFHLFNRNWEDDAFTTAVPTPQQGNVPLVGFSTNGEPVTVKFMNEDGSVNVVNLSYSNDGTINAVGPALDSQGNPVGSVADGLNVALNDAINFGITINDLRNVNALQLWLEKNVRKGYKYRDQIMSHFGISVDYDDLMMPEFIGGVSRDVTVNQISQTVETDTGNLGDMAGQAYVVGEGHSIQRYCDEHGYIIGILSVTPVPNYSQLIPKYLFKLNTFDYFFPEFGKIGMQPILKKEIAAISSWLEGSLDDTFGYQRAWYDYLSRVDEVHGKFNTDFYNFLLQRKFSSVPELGSSFTTVQDEHLNNIFYTDSYEDKILGQIYFDVSAMRPIPLYGIPSLE